MFRTILVPLDGSPWSEAALPFAIAIAQRNQSSISLVHVHVPFIGAYIEGMPIIDQEADEASRSADQAYLDAVWGKLSAENVMIHTTVLDGSTVPTLAAYAHTTQADLIVLTTHGRGRLARWWFGSVANELIQHAATPLLIIHPGEETTVALPPRAEHILVALDGTSQTNSIIDLALALNPNATLTLLSVVVPPVLDDDLLEFGGWSVETREEISQRRMYLDHVAQPLRERGVHVKTEVVAERSNTANVITSYAETANADLIALATHSRSTLRRALLGSTADSIIHASKLPLLIQRPQPERVVVAEHEAITLPAPQEVPAEV